MEVADDVKVKEEVKHEEAQEAPKAAEPEKAKAAEPVHDSAADEKVYTTHAVRVLATKMKVNLSQVAGTGKHGRVTKEDVINFVEKGGKPQAQKPKEEPKKETPKPQERVVKVGAPKWEMPPIQKKDKVVKLVGIRRAMVKSMTEALQIPQEIIIDQVNVEALKKVRNDYNKVNPKKKITYLPMFMKAVSKALLDFPMLNAWTIGGKDADGYLDEYTEKKNHNISVAVDSPSGLLVPNVKSVQNKSILQLNDDLRALIDRAKKSALTQEDLSDGTTTLSNIGNIGCIIGSAVIFRPQTSIMAIGKTRTMPRYVEVNGVKKVVPQDIITISVTADRRVAETATVVRFINQVKQFLENPDILLLNLK